MSLLNSELDYLSVLLISLLEGLTEFIPVSSTGHMIILEHLLGLHGEAIASFSIFIQLGAISAVAWLYWHRFRPFFSTCFYKDTFQLDFAIKIVIASIPVLVCGALFHSAIKTLLFSARPVAIALIVGGLLMLYAEQKPLLKSDESEVQISRRQALWIGLFQCLSLWPGMSRSGSCMIGSRLIGIPNKIAAEFSFIIAVPIMCAAVGYDLLKSMNELSIDYLGFFSLGFIISGITGILAIKFFIALLGKTTLIPFGVYRVIVGAVILATL